VGHRLEELDPLGAVDLAGMESKQRRLPGGPGQRCDRRRELSCADRPSVGPRRPDVDGVQESVDLADVVAVEFFEAEAAR
jgi:hypothetical protein